MGQLVALPPTCPETIFSLISVRVSVISPFCGEGKNHNSYEERKTGGESTYCPWHATDGGGSPGLTEVRQRLTALRMNPRIMLIIGASHCAPKIESCLPSVPQALVLMDVLASINHRRVFQK
ncbi:hypothetical protein AVEN_117964-1 [Araneus ventricosus]|uniref:Uncharacterized protein n=1 Tax=Araneus ventricosus TaxID=182803 RepID=A0A4Y2H6U4_ARAVE|nr:hypothetical protein AVEN_117964-1 [Araneus ventricosus]